jgi:hypothetical protein
MVSDRSFPNGSPVCDYWLGRCEGFAVRAGHRTLGVVDRVDHADGGRLAQAIVLRKRRKRRALDAREVLAVVPARKVILARRHERARPAVRRARLALRHGYAVAAPVVVAFAVRLRKEAVRLARLTAAEVRERNRQRVAPSTRRAHRAANRYTFALNSPTREG